jgi:hypothetical protein
MPRKNFLVALRGGDRRSIGRSDEVAAKVGKDPRLFPELIAGLWSKDSLVRMRAADAVEKVTRKHVELLQPYKKELLALMAESQEQELRWHLAAMVPRLNLNSTERHSVLTSLYCYLGDRSSIVKTFALQGLAELVQSQPRLRSQVIKILLEATHNGTPAMKARSRRLLAQLGKKT